MEVQVITATHSAKFVENLTGIALTLSAVFVVKLTRNVVTPNARDAAKSTLLTVIGVKEDSIWTEPENLKTSVAIFGKTVRS